MNSGQDSSSFNSTPNNAGQPQSPTGVYMNNTVAADSKGCGKTSFLLPPGTYGWIHNSSATETAKVLLGSQVIRDGTGDQGSPHNLVPPTGSNIPASSGSAMTVWAPAVWLSPSPILPHRSNGPQGPPPMNNHAAPLPPAVTACNSNAVPVVQGVRPKMSVAQLVTRMVQKKMSALQTELKEANARAQKMEVENQAMAAELECLRREKSLGMFQLDIGTSDSSPLPGTPEPGSSGNGNHPGSLLELAATITSDAAEDGMGVGVFPSQKDTPGSSTNLQTGGSPSFIGWDESGSILFRN